MIVAYDMAFDLSNQPAFFLHRLHVQIVHVFLVDILKSSPRVSQQP